MPPAHPTPVVSVIMPTLARPARAPLLRRALASALDQSGVRALPIVVVNGRERDPALVAELRARGELRVVDLPDPGLPAALRAGRAAVGTEWFAELDDDDLLLPGALARRLARAAEVPGCDAVASNGILRDESGERPLLADVAATARDPLAALAARTWLAPGSALFRSERVGPELFADMPAFLEWTYLALRLASERRVAFLEEATFVHHPGRPDSLWRSAACTRALPGALERLLARELPAPLRRSFTERRVHALHDACDEALRRGALGAAWVAHVRSLAGPGGWRYLPYTGRLLARRPGARAA